VFVPLGLSFPHLVELAFQGLAGLAVGVEVGLQVYGLGGQHSLAESLTSAFDEATELGDSLEGVKEASDEVSSELSDDATGVFTEVDTVLQEQSVLETLKLFLVEFDSLGFTRLGFGFRFGSHGSVVGLRLWFWGCVK